MTYFIDDGYVSLNHVNEELCGDKVEIVRNELGTTIVLADGLASGVKANILATLTSKLLGLMIANGANIEECVSSVIATLPVCSVRKVAYATFTVVHLDKNGLGYVFEFDNPHCLAYKTHLLSTNCAVVFLSNKYFDGNEPIIMVKIGRTR